MGHTPKGMNIEYDGTNTADFGVIMSLIILTHL